MSTVTKPIILNETGIDIVEELAGIATAIQTSVSPTEFIKNASVSGDTLTLTKKDNTTVLYSAYQKPASGIPDSDIASAETWNGKQDNLATQTATLTAIGWANSSQTVSVTGVTASNIVIVSPAPASVENYANAGIVASQQGNGTITFTCTTTPTADIVINVVIA